MLIIFNNLINQVLWPMCNVIYPTISNHLLTFLIYWNWSSANYSLWNIKTILHLFLFLHFTNIISLNLQLKITFYLPLGRTWHRQCFLLLHSAYVGKLHPNWEVKWNFKSMNMSWSQWSYVLKKCWGQKLTKANCLDNVREKMQTKDCLSPGMIQEPYKPLESLSLWQH